MISFERDVSFPRSVCACVHKHAHYFYARGHKLGTNTRKNTRISFVRVGTNTRTNTHISFVRVGTNTRTNTHISFMRVCTKHVTNNSKGGKTMFPLDNKEAIQ